jgi:hypothetical protein
MSAETLSSTEREALQILLRNGGGVLTTSVPDKNEKDAVFGTVTPGHHVYKKLEKKGFVFYTEEEPMCDPGGELDGFTFTNEIYITDEGRDALSTGV